VIQLNNLIANRQSWTPLLTVVLLATFLQGCVSIPKRNPVPDKLSEDAVIPGIQRARNWGDEKPAYTDTWMAKSKEELQAEYPEQFGGAHNYLAELAPSSTSSQGSALEP
jgi:hypothetical protein